MNEKPDRWRPDDTRLDRLVDGALPPDEYRTLLAELDQEPGGWRNCAMAFLESQALAGELGALRRSMEVSTAKPSPIPPAPTAPPLGLGARTWLAMAASVVLAFGLGVSLPDVWRGISQEPPAAGNSLAPGNVAALGGWSGPAADGVRHQAFRPVGNVRLVVDDAKGEPAIADEVPVYEIDQDLTEYVQHSQPAIDPAVLEWLQQRGHQIEVEMQYIPGRLEDGRPMYLPVEQYKITPVKRSY
jgi:hypothetical protein